MSHITESECSSTTNTGSGGRISSRSDHTALISRWLAQNRRAVVCLERGIGMDEGVSVATETLSGRDQEIARHSGRDNYQHRNQTRNLCGEDQCVCVCVWQDIGDVLYGEVPGDWEKNFDTNCRISENHKKFLSGFAMEYAMCFINSLPLNEAYTPSFWHFYCHLIGILLPPTCCCWVFFLNIHFPLLFVPAGYKTFPLLRAKWGKLCHSVNVTPLGCH